MVVYSRLHASCEVCFVSAFRLFAWLIAHSSNLERMNSSLTVPQEQVFCDKFFDNSDMFVCKGWRTFGQLLQTKNRNDSFWTRGHVEKKNLINCSLYTANQKILKCEEIIALVNVPFNRNIFGWDLSAYFHKGDLSNRATHYFYIMTLERVILINVFAPFRLPAGC